MREHRPSTSPTLRTTRFPSSTEQPEPHTSTIPSAPRHERGLTAFFAKLPNQGRARDTPADSDTDFQSPTKRQGGCGRNRVGHLSSRPSQAITPARNDDQTDRARPGCPQRDRRPGVINDRFPTQNPLRSASAGGRQIVAATRSMARRIGIRWSSFRHCRQWSRVCRRRLGRDVRGSLW